MYTEQLLQKSFKKIITHEAQSLIACIDQKNNLSIQYVDKKIAISNYSCMCFHPRLPILFLGNTIGNFFEIRKRKCYGVQG